MKVALYDAKPYDEEFFSSAEAGEGIEFVFHPFRLSAATANSAKGFDAICVFVNDEVDEPCLEALAELGVKMIALRCAGFNNVALKCAAQHGIAVTRVPAYSPHAVAEHAVALLLTLNRHIHRAYNRVREHNFSLNGLVGFDLYGKTMGIVGTGKIGRIAAEIFRGFGMKVIAFDTHKDEEWATEHDVTYVPLQELFAQSDVISLHLPLNQETHHVIDIHAIEQMKEDVFLINTSRGKLIDTAALIPALKEGKLGGVALDVYEIEEGVFFEDRSHDPLEDDDLARLVSFPNVLITSHQGFFTKEALGEIARVSCENLKRFGDGEEFLDGTAVEAE